MHLLRSLSLQPFLVWSLSTYSGFPWISFLYSVDFIPVSLRFHIKILEQIWNKEFHSLTSLILRTGPFYLSGMSAQLWCLPFLCWKTQWTRNPYIPLPCYSCFSDLYHILIRHLFSRLKRVLFSWSHYRSNSIPLITLGALLWAFFNSTIPPSWGWWGRMKKKNNTSINYSVAIPWQCKQA